VEEKAISPAAEWKCKERNTGISPLRRAMKPHDFGRGDVFIGLLIIGLLNRFIQPPSSIPALRAWQSLLR
jgi:hypothetical protein